MKRELVSYEKILSNEGCSTPDRSECRIPEQLECPPPPKKRSFRSGKKGNQSSSKKGYFHPPELDLELLFTVGPRQQACA
ncbi:hypothetical protein Tsubulata_027904 [Turnera subulata]|uniref:Uncharacterized protein n=1 Tax=Turnera subulata TaxID=218843 RepID=A0A9Q0JQU1_9ROSI|nr:hypothetical protein Tsubulata_027904 [Turnera subulata]